MLYHLYLVKHTRKSMHTSFTMSSFIYYIILKKVKQNLLFLLPKNSTTISCFPSSLLKHQHIECSQEHMQITKISGTNTHLIDTSIAILPKKISQIIKFVNLLWSNDNCHTWRYGVTTLVIIKPKTKKSGWINYLFATKSIMP